jgi:hypothetical protein
MNPCLIGAGRALIWAGFKVTFCPANLWTTAAGRYFGSSAKRRALKIDPKSDTPIDAPIERKNVAADVAVPRWPYGTAFWTATTSTCMTRPIPSPSTNMYTDAVKSVVDGVMSARR